MESAIHLRVLLVGRSKRIMQELSNMLSALPVTAHKIEGSSVEDDALTAMEVMVATSQKEGLQWVRSAAPHIIILEIGHSNGGRNQFAELIRQRLPGARLLALCQNTLALGEAFHDLITLPLDPVQVCAVIAQSRIALGNCIYKVGDFSLNTANRVLETKNGSFQLRPKECALLELLIIRRNHVVTRRAIMLEIWQTTFLADTGTLDVHIRWLRNYLEEDPSLPKVLATVRGKGFILKLP